MLQFCSIGIQKRKSGLMLKPFGVKHEREEGMNYHIEVKNSKEKWDIIASFEHSVDRDDCILNMRERYSDCEFRPVDD